MFVKASGTAFFSIYRCKMHKNRNYFGNYHEVALFSKKFPILVDRAELPLYNLHIDPSLATIFFVKLKEELQ